MANTFKAPIFCELYFSSTTFFFDISIHFPKSSYKLCANFKAFRKFCDSLRKRADQHESFDFLGYGFRARLCKGRNCFVGFTPAVSKSAIKAMGATIRGWKLQLWSSASLEDIAKRINPVVRGWLNYYGKFRKSALNPILRQIQYALVRWAMRKYKRLRGHWLRATHWLGRIARREPRLLVSWAFGFRPSVGR